jgi:hypothetical protein
MGQSFAPAQSTTPAPAQQPTLITPGPVLPPPVAQVVAQEVARLTILLSLDSSQAESARSYFMTEEVALATINASMATAMTQISTAVETNNSTGLSNAASQVGALAAQEAMARGIAEAELYVILNSEQQTRYKVLLAGVTLTASSVPCKPGSRACISPL